MRMWPYTSLQMETDQQPTVSRGQGTETQPLMIQTSVRLPEPVWRAVKLRAVDLRTSAQEVITQAILQYMKEAA